MKKAIVRLIVLAVLLVNQALVTFGWDPLPFDEEQIYNGVSMAATTVWALWTWFKNNNVTNEAQETQAQLDEKKRKRRRKSKHKSV